MKTPKFSLTKNSLKKALRTFLQTAIGYIITNITLHLGGIDFADGDVIRNALIGLAIAAFSAGSAAVMNIEKDGCEVKDAGVDDKSEVINEDINEGEEKLNG